MSKKIQKDLEKLVTLCLEENSHQEYTDEDLLMATHIFSHILFDVVYTTNKDNLSFKNMADLSEQVGNAIRELVKISTDKDLHDIARKET
jgi:hypothetical protein